MLRPRLGCRRLEGRFHRLSLFVVAMVLTVGAEIIFVDGFESGDTSAWEF